ncbi:NADH dehydrogenase [ubiquinone] iron-sulfur protein 5 isoform X2 [Thalassophryne amazonica]|uniref:NADH dehydrogenase [ubiquinone] iron-sulfur protein 5 isoform X2 n=1 Tax=Thalassophryne amazonica TaxID=390379 RepID=UPI0014719A20|nr:NADH dehydrogenase [ubiquinone] iron-sulfur protein 5 isoform X2 [Thalassophryne amazonica]
MPMLDLNKWLGLSLDQWILVQSGKQPYKQAARCHAFEKEWIECGHGIGQVRAKRECQQEYEDFCECLHMKKVNSRLHTIQKQRDKLMKEGKYTPPLHHLGKVEEGP